MNSTINCSPSPKGGSRVNKTNESKTNGNEANQAATNDWKTYRTRFLVRARQLVEPVTFTDAIGREHHGGAGDYLVESSDGTMRIAPKALFEDIYVAMPSVYQNGKSASVSETAAPRKRSYEYRVSASA
jgi:hypothetical protein